MKDLDFFRLGDFSAATTLVPNLPLYLPQVRFRTALRGHLRDGSYAIRAKEIIGKRGRVKSADEVREALGLGGDQLLVALLFDDDEVIERLYEDTQRVQLLAEASYDLIVSASFSIWNPRPRLHNLRNLMRSLDLCISLQQRGATAIPRLDWQLEHDVLRWVEWLHMNPCIEVVAIDAMTCATNGWDEVLEGLGLLDELTGGKLKFLVNGPSTEARWSELFSLIPANRLCLTEARPISAPPTAQEKLRFGREYRRALGPRFKARVLRRRAAIVESARRAA
jgi:hypothetical protein